MSLESVRVAINTAIESAKVGFSPGYTLVIEYDNRDVVDLQTQTNPFLSVEIKLIDGEQASLGTNAVHRLHGQLYLIACVKEGNGMKAANTLLDWFYPKLHAKSFGTVHTRMATLAAPTTHLGWVYYPIIIPFWSDQN